MLYLAAGVCTLVAAGAWLWRRARARGRSFLDRLRRFSDDTERALIEQGSARAEALHRSISVSSSSLRDRVKESDRQRAVLKGLITEGLELDKCFRWPAARQIGEERRQFQACTQGLSQRLARVEQEAKELTVMAEIDQLLARLRSVGGGGVVFDGNGGLSTRTGGHGTLDDNTLPARLDLLLNLSDNSSSDGGGTRCVFRNELRRWRDRLVGKEQNAINRLKLGLQSWNLDMVDKALAQLHLLGLPEIVKEFQERREYVSNKRLQLGEDLKVRKEQEWRWWWW